MNKWPVCGLITLVSGLPACSPFVPVMDTAAAPIQQKAAASQVQIYHLGERPPHGFTYVGDLVANSCKHMLWDAPASMSDAVLQLKLKAVMAGADAIIDLSCTRSGTDTYGTDCWNSYQCGGTGIKLSAHRAE